MTPDEYTRALKKAKDELDQYLRQRGEIDRKIIRLKSTVEALSALCEEQEFSIPLDLEIPKGFGITMTIRKVLSESTVPLFAVQIRDALEAHGIDMKEYANQMAVIHNTLNRLVAQGEVMLVRNLDGQTAGYSLYVERTISPELVGGALKAIKKMKLSETK